MIATQDDIRAAVDRALAYVLFDDDNPGVSVRQLKNRRLNLFLKANRFRPQHQLFIAMQRFAEGELNVKFKEGFWLGLDKENRTYLDRLAGTYPYGHSLSDLLYMLGTPHADAAASLGWYKAQSVSRWMMNESVPADPWHPYLVKKHLPPFGLRQFKDQLLIPVFDETFGHVINIQRINKDGQKRFVKGGRIKGGLHILGKLNLRGTVYLGEGYATVLSLMLLTQECCGVVAFSASNMLAVGRHLQCVLPELDLVIAADFDGGINNQGLGAAMDAAKFLQVEWVTPETRNNQHKVDFSNVWIERLNQ